MKESASAACRISQCERAGLAPDPSGDSAGLDDGGEGQGPTDRLVIVAFVQEQRGRTVLASASSSLQ